MDHEEYRRILSLLRKIPGIKKVFIRSGLRFDYIMADPRGEAFLNDICAHHVSGQLKVAPEHRSKRVLRHMRKPPAKVYDRFRKAFERINQRQGKKQYIIPYYISSHPGSTLEDALELALALKREGFVPDQVQDFYPTPGTRATCMYVTGQVPETGEEIFVARGSHARGLQRALLQFHKTENHKLVREALQQLGRHDLMNPGGLMPRPRRKKPTPPGRRG